MSPYSSQSLLLVKHVEMHCSQVPRPMQCSQGVDVATLTKHHTLCLQGWSTAPWKALMWAARQRQLLQQLLRTPYWAMQFPYADQGGMLDYQIRLLSSLTT